MHTERERERESRRLLNGEAWKENRVCIPLVQSLVRQKLWSTSWAQADSTLGPDDVSVRRGGYSSNQCTDGEGRDRSSAGPAGERPLAGFQWGQESVEGPGLQAEGVAASFFPVRKNSSLGLTPETQPSLSLSTVGCWSWGRVAVKEYTYSFTGCTCTCSLHLRRLFKCCCWLRSRLDADAGLSTDGE